MKQYCRYHPLSPALWSCPSCHRHYDKLCVPDGNEEQQIAKCPYCQTSMEFLSKRMEMPPFWKIPERFFSQTFKSDIFLFILLISLCSGFMYANVALAFLIGIVISLVTINYALLIAQSLIKANKSHRPSGGYSNKVPGITTAFNLTQIKSSLAITGAIWLFISPIIIQLDYFHGLGAFIYSIISLALLPSIILMLMTPKRLYSAKHTSLPSWISIIKQMGLSYLSLVSYFAFSLLSALIVIDICRGFLPSYAIAPLCTLVISFIIFSLFSVLAYIHTRYESFFKLSKTAKKPKTEDSEPSENPIRFDADLDIAIKEGDYAKAIELLESSFKGKRSDLRTHQLYTLLLEHKDLEKLDSKSHSFLELLLGRGQKLAAYELVELLREGRTKFLIHDVKLSLNLAETFHEMKEYQLVLWLAQDAHKRFDANTDLAKLYLLAAKTILSKTKAPEQSRGYLQFISGTFPDTEFQQHAMRLLEHLDSRN